VPADAASKTDRQHAGKDEDRERMLAVSTTAAIEPQTQRTRRDDGWERDQMVDRLRSLRRVLPVLAQEMAAARRQAAHLRVDNRRLTEQVRELRSELEAHDRRAASPGCSPR
jgi:hypothetical protein